ncbi:MAG TPA: AsmA family protein, partial [Terriglobia bacterium]
MRKPAIIVGAVIVFLIVVGAAARFNVNSYRPQIQSRLGQALNRNVSMGNVSLRLVPPRLRVENPVIADDAAFDPRSPFVQADALDVSLRLLPLLAGHVDISSMKLQRPNVELIKNAQGVWNVSTLGGGRTSHGGGTFSIGALSIKDGQVAVTDLERKQPRTVYDHIDLTLKDYAPGKAFSADVAAHLPGPGAEDLHLQGKAGPVPAGNMAMMPFSGTLDLKQVGLGGLQKFAGNPMLAKTDGVLSGQTTINSSSGTLAASGNLKIEKPVVNGVDVGYPISADYKLSGNLAAGQIKIDSATVKLGQTPITVTGSLNTQHVPPQVDLSVKSGEISIGEISRLASAFGVVFSPQTTVAGRIALNVQARGPADRPQLTGTISGQDIKIAAKEIRQPIGIRAIDLTLTPTAIQSNNFEISSGSTTVASHVALENYASKSPAIDLTVRAPNATLPEILAIARAYGITALDRISGGSGTLSLDLHATGPVRQISSPEVLRALNGSLNLNFSGLRIAG